MRRFGIALIPIDDAARDGAPRLVSDGRHNATARWRGDAWTYPSGRHLAFEPTSYKP